MNVPFGYHTAALVKSPLTPSRWYCEVGKYLERTNHGDIMEPELTANRKKCGTLELKLSWERLKLNAAPAYRSTSSTRSAKPFQPSLVVFDASIDCHVRLEAILRSGLVELVRKSGRDVPSGASRWSYKDRFVSRREK